MAANLSLKLGQRAPAAALAGRGKRVVARFANDTAPAGGKARVEFVLPRHVPFGQEVAVVGEAETLGKWDATAAVPLTWTDGDIWTATAEVPVGSAVEYKYIVRLPDNGEVLEWQPCANLVIELPPAAGAATVKDEWEGAHEVVIGGGAAAAPKAAAAAPAPAPVAEEAPAAKPAAAPKPAAAAAPAAAKPAAAEEPAPVAAAAPKAAAAPAIGKGPVVAAGATEEEEAEPEAPKTNGKPRGRPSTSSKAPKGRRSA